MTHLRVQYTRVGPWETAIPLQLHSVYVFGYFFFMASNINYGSSILFPF